eukprot:CAMPEP_0179070280 /NCGR_PEP_ID=MMETSP0796-20121207/30938_1 /TAXON_ID=73915 /ORGANISM="Pyrodinium bahamense, Strain pbaha01" /LENGTH=67 /DNA_ID=CAMNT_0020767365 /DNA_START=36 /DNA_END=239 /DNA_ORIENTATION=-
MSGVQKHSWEENYGASAYDDDHEGEHWTDYCGMIVGCILLIVIVAVLAWAYYEDQKEIARLSADTEL